jgi:hypothetical protein
MKEIESKRGVLQIMDPEFDVTKHMTATNRLWYRLFGDMGMAIVSSIIVFVALRVILYADLVWWQDVLVFLALIAFANVVIAFPFFFSCFSLNLLCFI